MTNTVIQPSMQEYKRFSITDFIEKYTCSQLFGNNYCQTEKVRGYDKTLRKLLNTKRLLGNNHFTSKDTDPTQPAITCSKLTVETLEQGMKYIQS